jgi:hypothetical protein
MKPILLLVPAGLLLAVAIVLLPKSGPYQPPAHPTVFDTSLTILRDLILAGDHRLGFKDTAEMNGAWVDTLHGLPLYYAVRDSFVNQPASGATSPEKEGLLDLHRKMFPVYGREGFLRAAITFDSSPAGWVPMEFDEGSVLRSFVGFSEHDPRAAHGGKIVEAPFLENQFFIGKDSNGKEIVYLRSEELEEIKKDLPPNERNSKVLPIADFISATKATKP